MRAHTHDRNSMGQSRRDIGHGALAERALRSLVPGADTFATQTERAPFVTRLSCEVLESNGSSSMASVCAGALALIDADVQLSQIVRACARGCQQNAHVGIGCCDWPAQQGLRLRNR
jgi:polyribonucleotide nucleotidyltransferase